MGRALPAARRCAFYPYVLHPPARASGEVGPARRWVSRLRAGEVPPFSRLAVVHGLSSAGDAMVAIALAGSIFFNVSVKAAQSRVALSLALTVAPFAIVGPLLGPVVERVRGGRRAIVAGVGRGPRRLRFLHGNVGQLAAALPGRVLHARFLQALFGGEGGPRAVRRWSGTRTWCWPIRSCPSAGPSPAWWPEVSAWACSTCSGRGPAPLRHRRVPCCAPGRRHACARGRAPFEVPAASRQRGRQRASWRLMPAAGCPALPGRAPALADDGRPAALGLPPAPSAVRRPVLAAAAGGDPACSALDGRFAGRHRFCHVPAGLYLQARGAPPWCGTGWR